MHATRLCGRYAVTRVGGRKVQEASAEVTGLKRPAVPLELYEFEGCPFCKKVRGGGVLAPVP